jgi:hypothetical protein
VEQAIAAALPEEEAARKTRGDRPLEEEPEYKGFLDTAVERLALRPGSRVYALIKAQSLRRIA